MWSRLLPAGLLVGAIGAAAPLAVTACSGGTAADWAVAHQHGGIVRGVVATSEDRPDFTTDLIVTNLERLAGEPPPFTQIHTVAGLVCDQSADPGETIVVLYDIRGAEVSYPLPLYYVVMGPDALEPDLVADLFGPGAPAPTPTEGPTMNEAPIRSEAPIRTTTAAGLALPIAFVVVGVIGGLALLLIVDARRRRRR
jgi:hypothetical protein